MQNYIFFYRTSLFNTYLTYGTTNGKMCEIYSIKAHGRTKVTLTFLFLSL